MWQKRVQMLVVDATPLNEGLRKILLILQTEIKKKCFSKYFLRGCVSIILSDPPWKNGEV